MKFPVIIGMGGLNPAGRTSFNNSFNWLIFDEISLEQKKSVIKALAMLKQDISYNGTDYIYNEQKLDFDAIPPSLLSKLQSETLIRKINLPGGNKIKYRQKFSVKNKQDLLIRSQEHSLDHLSGAKITSKNETDNFIHLADNADLYIVSDKDLKSNSGGQLPSGIDFSKIYNNSNHPRALSMAIYGVSDALNSLGISWDDLQAKVGHNKIGVYASSMLGNYDEFGILGVTQSGLLGKRNSSKQLSLSMPQMVADFINAYIIGNVGHTQANIGACASFLYNLHSANNDIQSGRCRLAIVGSSDAPLVPEMIEAYNAMGALATDKYLRELDKLGPNSNLDHSRACRPFSENRGFVLGESSQFFILADVNLAIELGIPILGGIGGVCINADGFKTSISKPGPGNLISLANACNLAKSIVGEEKLRRNTFVSAHGTGTPQNRATESWILSKVAGLFGISDWPICAIKSYIGHSTGAAAGDQLSYMLGTFHSQIIPKINTIKEIADDVFSKNLKFCLENLKTEKDQLAGGFINTKGFGGNNASAFILSSGSIFKYIQQEYGVRELNKFLANQEKALELAKEKDEHISKNMHSVFYNTNSPFQETDDVRIEDGYLVWGDLRYKLGLD